MSGYTGGFNKIMRNIVAGASDTEFEKVSRSGLTTCQRLTKCTFHLDSKEPKEKHVICKYPHVSDWVIERRSIGMP